MGRDVYSRAVLTGLLALASAHPVHAAVTGANPAVNPVQNTLVAMFDNGAPEFAVQGATIWDRLQEQNGRRRDLPSEILAVYDGRARDAAGAGAGPSVRSEAAFDSGTDELPILTLDDTAARGRSSIGTQPKLVIVEGANGPVAAVTQANILSLSAIQDGAIVLNIDDIDTPATPPPADGPDISNAILLALLGAGVTACAGLAGRRIVRTWRPKHSRLQSRLLDGRRR